MNEITTVEMGSLQYYKTILKMLHPDCFLRDEVTLDYHQVSGPELKLLVDPSTRPIGSAARYFPKRNNSPIGTSSFFRKTSKQDVSTMHRTKIRPFCPIRCVRSEKSAICHGIEFEFSTGCQMGTGAPQRIFTMATVCHCNRSVTAVKFL